MKNLIFILSLAMASIANAQSIFPLGSPTQGQQARFGFILDSCLKTPIKDTTWSAAYTNVTPTACVVFRPGDKGLYYNTGVRWSRLVTSSDIASFVPAGRQLNFVFNGVSLNGNYSADRTVSFTEVDGSVSNEGALTVSAGTATTAVIGSNTSGSTPVTLTAGTGIGISETGNNITLTATGTAPGTNTAAAYGTGTGYTLTTTSAKVTFGTASPSITIPTAGTYLIMANVKIEYTGLLTALPTTANLKLRRINNTAADLSNATTTYNIPALSLTALTQTAGDADIAPIIYTTTNNNDVVEIWGNRGANVTAGAVVIGEASIVAVRIY